MARRILNILHLVSQFLRASQVYLWTVVFTVLLAPWSEGQIISPSPLVKQDISLNEKIETQLQEMSLREKIGQLFIFGFSGKKPSKELKNWLREKQPGALIIFKRNVRNLKQTKKLTDFVQSMNRQGPEFPTLLMVDQEGGVVSRIPLPRRQVSALALAQSENTQLIREYGFGVGQILNKLGLNVNLAPVLDLSDPDKRSFLENRSFGLDPVKVAEQTYAFSRGLTEAGVIPVGKHFPGHGSDLADSHKELPVRTETLPQLLKKDLVPFKKFSTLTKFPIGIMGAHLAFPNIDASGQPATFSKILVTDVLKRQLGFSGLVITDDIEMAGASKAGSISERAIEALHAGCDMIMVAWSRKRQRAAYRGLHQAVKNGKISENLVNDRVRRILWAKAKVAEAKKRLKLPKLSRSLKHLDQLSTRVILENFEKSMDENRNLAGALRDYRKVVILSSDSRAFRELRNVIGKKVRYVPLRRNKPIPWSRIRNNKLFIFVVTGQGSRKLLDRAPKDLRKKIIVINASYPGAIRHPGWFAKVFNFNTYDSILLKEFGNYFFKSPSQRTRRPAEVTEAPFRTQTKPNELADHSGDKKTEK